MQELKNKVLSIFRMRSLMDHSSLNMLSELLGSFSSFQELIDFQSECFASSDPMDVPFVNRNFQISRNLWVANSDRLRAS